MNCALCNSIHSTLLSRRDCKSGKKLNVFLCDHCGLVQQLPLPDPAELQRYYATEYRLDYKRIHQPKSKHILRSARLAVERERFLRKAGVYSGRLLDIGAGSGEFVTICNRSGFQAEGAEPHVGYSEFARSQYGANVRTLELADLDGTYDVITLFHVLEHLPSPRDVFARLSQLLNPSGHLLIEVPWGLSPSISPSNRYFKAHLYYFELETLAACASTHFEPVTSSETGNLQMLFRRRDHTQPIRMPTPDFAVSAKARALRLGWWSYLTTGKGHRALLRKIRRCHEERGIRHLSGSAILNLFSSPTKVAGPLKGKLPQHTG